MNDENKYEPYQYGMPEEPEGQETSKNIEHGEENSVEHSEENSVVETPYYFYDEVKQASQPDEEAPKKKMKLGVKIAIILGIAIVFGAISAVVFQGTNFILERYFGENAKGALKDSVEREDNSTGATLGKTEIIANEGTTVESQVADVAENVMPSVVSITSMSVQEVQTFPFGGVTQYEVPSSGSGIIIGQNEKEILIVTNNHVVEDSKTLTVVWIDGNSNEAQIRGTDADRDLAIITVPLASLKSSTTEAIKVATIGDSSALRVGEPTIAIGNALGYGQSVTCGIVSALKRTLEGVEGELIQTDAAINPGNSGGALLNANGEVIGINSAKVSSAAVEGMGYAIPISDVTNVLEELMNQKTREKVSESERGTLGIQGINLTSDVAAFYNIPAGIYVQSLVKGGGAEKANLPIRSVITELNGKKVDTLDELIEELQYYKKGETVKVTCYVQSLEGYVEKTYKITLN